MLEFHNYTVAPYPLGTGAGTSLRFQVGAMPKALWLDFSDFTTLWLASDETGGNVSAERETIGKIDDKSGNNLHFTQADAGKEPEFNRLLKANADLSGEPDLVPDPYFGDDTGWTLQGEWTIADNTLSITDSTSTYAAYLDNAPEAGKWFYYEFTVDSGSMYGLYQAANGYIGGIGKTAGTYTGLFQSDGTPVRFVVVANRTVVISHFSLKEIPDSELVNVITPDGVDDAIGVDSGSLPSNCSIFCAVKTTDTSAVLFSDKNVNIRYLGALVDGNPSVPYENAGTPTTHVDDGPNLATRDALHTAIADDAWHTLEIAEANLSGWANFSISYPGTATASNNFAGRIGESVIIIPTANLTEARRHTILAYLRKGVGL
ncbi:hypothetical protein [Oricola indica]|uniref:hypothetical protein n=1 Tax=Oricola indica TaxID=2872591 RepID=UPI003CCBD8C4